MKIKSAKFIKGAMGTDDIFSDETPKIVFIGRSNVGKSSVINAIAKQKDLARTSSFPGRTRQINIFLINNSFYLIDLPGYGFAKTDMETRQQLRAMVNWFLFESEYEFKKVVLIIDASIGPSTDDMDLFVTLEKENKDIIILANKIDKIKKSDFKKQTQRIREIFNERKVIFCSTKNNIGIGELADEITK